MNIENVDWQITSNCNRMCPYCFGPSGVADLPISESKHVVDILEKLGAKQIGITGGEPLLYPHIAELIEYIFAKGMSVVFILSYWKLPWGAFYFGKEEGVEPI